MHPRAYAAARACRTQLDLDADAVFPVDHYIGQAALGGSAAVIEGVVVRDSSVGLVLPRGRRSQSTG